MIHSPTSKALAVPEASGLEASSTVIRPGAERRYSELPSSYPLMGLRSTGTIRDRHRAQQTDRQAKAEATPQRASRNEPGPEAQGPLQGYAEPPFSLDVLTDMLYESPTYYSIVRQFGIDACSGWALVDRTQGAPNFGELSPSLDADAVSTLQRVKGERMLDSMCFDYDENHITVTTFSQALLNDRDSTGNAHAEVVRHPETRKPAKYIHMPARLVRRGVDGKTFAQLDEAGRAVAFFRRYGAEVAPPATEEKPSDTPWAYLTAEEAAEIQGNLPRDPRTGGINPGPGQRAGDLKPELVDFKIYHPRERYYGIPPIVAAFQAVVGNVLASNRNIRFFINRGIPEWLFMIKAPAAAFRDPDTKTNIIDKIQNTLEEHMKYCVEGEDFRTLTLKVPINEYDVTLEKLGGDPKDQEWGTYQTSNRDIQVQVYGMQPSKIGIQEVASLGTGSGESQDETYKRSQIDPRQDLLEAWWDLQLDELGMEAVRFEYHEFDVVDEQREATIAIGFFGTGAFSINDIRAWASRLVKDQDFPPDDHEWASVPVKLLEMQVAGMLAAAGAAPGEPTLAAGYPSGRMGNALGRLAGLAGIGGGARDPAEALERIRSGSEGLRGRMLPPPSGNGARPVAPAGPGGGLAGGP